jgi:hypothetical protein
MHTSSAPIERNDDGMSVFGIRNRDDWLVPRAFQVSSFAIWYNQISHFHELFLSPMTTPLPPPVVVGGSPFTPLARKMGSFCGVGRWHIITQAAGQDR